MWDKKYSTDDYIFGTTPNDFLQENFNILPKGNILSLADGEGRNSVFLAKHGYNVTTVDSSQVALDKAQKLAENNHVAIKTIHADLANFELGTNKWDGIISIFCHLPSKLRQNLYKKIIPSLKNNGIFLLEAYTPEQLKYDTGGPKIADNLIKKANLLKELPSLEFTHLKELERNVTEGTHHTGHASVIQAIAIKK